MQRTMAGPAPGASIKPSIIISRLLAVSVFSLVGLSFIRYSAQAQAAGLPVPVRLPLWPEGSIPAGKESEGEWDIQWP